MDLEAVSEEALTAGRMLSGEEVAAPLDACADDPSAAGARDAAMIALWYVAGPRRSEIVSLDLDDYDPESGAVMIRRAKRNKDRIIYVDNGAKDALDDWLRERGDEPGPLFVPVHQSSKVRIEWMTDQAVYYILDKGARQAGIDNVSPHDLRRTAISNLIEITDLVTAQHIAGHSDPKTTAAYDRRGEEAKQKAAAAIPLPYRGTR